MVLILFAAVLAAASVHALTPFPEFSAPRAITHGPHDHMFASYYGVNAWSPDDRYVLVLETDVNGRLPMPGEKATIGVVDTSDGDKFIPVAETTCWNFQEGTMAHWLPSEECSFVYNDMRGGRFVSVVVDFRTRAERVIPWPVSAVSADGAKAISINYARMRLTRPDYGYAGGGQDAREGVAFPDDDGLFLVDLKTGDAKLIVTIASVKDQVPQVKAVADKPGAPLSYFCHTVFSRDGKKVFWLSRSVDWYDKATHKHAYWHTTAFTCDIDGGNVRRCFPDGWGSSHFNWKPARSERDAATMIVTCNWQNKVYTHVEFTVGEEDKAHQVGGDAMNFDGHCIYTPDGNFISGDGYWDDKFFRHWKMVRLADNAVKDIGDFFVPEVYRDVYCRCDLHPRWRSDGRQLAFNSVHEGTRQIYVIDARNIVFSR